MSKEYKDIIKSNFLFGSIKIFQMLLNFVRIKLVSVILGPSGMGILSLFNSSILTLHQFSTFGIYTSAVREISSANSENIRESIINVFKLLVLIFGILGTFIMIIFSGTLSRLVFGSEDYKVGFIILSFALIFESIVNGFVAIFQGLRKLSELAKGSLIGAGLSIAFSIPFLYVWGEKGIPFSIIAGFFAMSLGYGLFAKKVQIHFNFNNIGIKDLFSHAMPIIKMGSLLMFSSGLMTIFALVLNSFINRHGTSADVGFYSASVTLTYGSITIFTSILASDYFPRLSALKDSIEFKQVVNNQIELLLLVLSPIVVFLILYTHYIVVLLFTAEFLQIVPMVRFMATSLILRVIWQSFSYIILANGDTKRFLLFDTLLGNGSLFLMNILSYYFYGLIGLSISYVAGAFFMVTLLFIIVSFTYGVKIERKVLGTIGLVFSFCVIAFLLSNFLNHKFSGLISGIWLIIVFSTSFFILNKKSDLTKKLYGILKNKR